jgi:hypothetical protein
MKPAIFAPVVWVLSIAGTWLLVWYAVVLLGRAL